MAKLLPIIIVLTGVLSGFGLGLFLRPLPEAVIDCSTSIDEHADTPAPCPTSEHEIPPASNNREVDPETVQYVKLNNQFVIPVVTDGAVTALVVMSLSIETIPSMTDTVFKMEPKLRDSLLQVMFTHANSGGFEGQFTRGEAMKDLRGSLLEAVQAILGPDVSNVLVTDILRQEV